MDDKMELVFQLIQDLDQLSEEDILSAKESLQNEIQEKGNPTKIKEFVEEITDFALYRKRKKITA